MPGPALAIAAVSVLALVFSSSPKKKAKGVEPPPNALPPGGFPNTANAYGLIGCDPHHTPSGKLSPRAVSGYATHPDYQWCYRVKEGDSAGSITEMFFNSKDGWRYSELLTANPQKLTKGTTIAPDVSPDAELNFASMEPGEILYLPRTWNPYIDQTGIPRPKYPEGSV